MKIFAIIHLKFVWIYRLCQSSLVLPGFQENHTNLSSAFYTYTHSTLSRTYIYDNIAFWILWKAKHLGVGCCSGSKLYLTLLTPWTKGFLRQEYWSELPFASPVGLDLPNPEIKPLSPALTGRFFTAQPLGKPRSWINYNKYKCIAKLLRTYKQTIQEK